MAGAGWGSEGDRPLWLKAPGTGTFGVRGRRATVWFGWKGDLRRSNGNPDFRRKSQIFELDPASGAAYVVDAANPAAMHLRERKMF
jgi:hypothetical protein